MTAPHKVAFPARCAVNICYDKHLCSQVFPAGIPVEGFFEGMVELFDADLKRKGFDGVALPAGSYELHKINGVRLDINKSLDELGVQDGDTLVLVPRVAGESFEPQYESLSTGLAAMGKWLGRDGGDRMFAPVTSLTAAHTAMAIIAMAVGVVLALTLRTRTITDSPVPAAMAGGIESSSRSSGWRGNGASSTTSITLSLSTVTDPVTVVARCARPRSCTATTATPSCTRTPPPDRLLAKVIGSFHLTGRRPRSPSTAHDHAG